MLTDTGIIIVDHGSRRVESNAMLERVAELFAERFSTRYGVVEAAHMELSEPSIATAYARCVDRGATRVVVCPFFLGPGKHWTQDIPRLTADAAQRFPGTSYHVAQTLGIDDLILDLLDKRANHCVVHNYRCDACRGSTRSGEPAFAPTAAVEHKPENGQCSSCPFVVKPDGAIVDKRKAPVGI